jgi:hypothetical protein
VTTLLEASRLALEALKNIADYDGLADARAALRQAIEQAEQPAVPLGDRNPGLQWDNTPQAFNDWWDSDYDPTGNPFRQDSAAYWAWAGWKAAIEQAEQAQPVAVFDENLGRPKMFANAPMLKHGQTLYTAPPPRQPWVGLTMQEIKDCIPGNVQSPDPWLTFVRAAEAKLKEKNT